MWKIVALPEKGRSMQFISAHAQGFLLVVTAVLLFAVLFLNFKHSMLKDESTAQKKPYSFARFQLAWWSVIILASFVTILFSKNATPELHASTIILLGISFATTATARLIDVSDSTNAALSSAMIQNKESKGFFLDILSDAGGVSIHRFQTVVFNASIGIWFFVKVFNGLSNEINVIIPDISNNVLILLGLSSGTYAAMKATENKTAK